MMAMEKLILITVLLVGIYASVSVAQNCNWISNENFDCIDRVECPDQGFNIDIWEDCEVGVVLFTADESVEINEEQCSDIFSYTGKDVTLLKSLNATGENGPEEEPVIPTCFPFLPPDATQDLMTIVTIKDVDEYIPTVLIPESYIVDDFYETDLIGIELLRFGVTDNDFGETKNIKMIDDDLGADSDNGKFEFTWDIVDDTKFFIITNKEPIDYENQVVYTLNYNISSSDGRGYSSGDVQQKVMVFVQDVSDMPPVWVQPQPAIQLSECESGTLAFTVKAQDRDTNIGNPIIYSIIKGNDDGYGNVYFQIDQDTGSVTTILNIDREEMLDTLSFALTIEAKEVSDEPPANGKDNATQVTNIYITDINDNSPVFDKVEYTYEMEELSQILERDRELVDLVIYVADMDQDDSGTYEVSSLNTGTPSNTGQLEVVTPSPTGRLNSSVMFRAKFESGHFDYETVEDSPLQFKLIATEIADDSHINEVILTITLRDINDNKPVFLEKSYTASINENEIEGSSVCTVAATDNDKNPAFGTLSIRYSFRPSCSQLVIDEKSGEVTVSSNRFDFEDAELVECTVLAQDSEGEGDLVNESDVKITIRVNDVPDGVPALELSPQDFETPENYTEAMVLCNLMATDNDASANISFTIDWENSIPNNKDEIKGWFEIPDATKEETGFTSQIMALPSKLDREVVDKITLRIVATDDSSNNVNNNDQDFTLTITDINDCWPEFSSDFSSEYNIKEYYGLKGCQDGDVIAFIGASDADENPTIFYESSESDYVEVNSTGYLLVKNASLIDREEEAQFTVDITISDEDSNSNTQTVTINVGDMNDNRPVFDMSICDTSNYTISEDAENGTYFGATVKATDKDEDKHAIPLYRLLTIEQNYQTPFTINSTTGEITVFQNSERFLDRERESFWNLLITAIDRCGDYTSDPTCTVLESDPRCMINVTVTDVNDEAPKNFKIYKDNEIVHTITISESVKAGSDLGYEILAFDDDEPNTDNSKINYDVKGVYIDDEPFTNISFKAINLNRNNTQTDNMEYYFRLTSETDLTHQKGSYTIRIEATDGGEPTKQTNETLYLEVTDANDYGPQFDFSQSKCPDNTFIKMEENNIENTFLNCSTGLTDQFKFRINDDDSDPENREVEVKILVDNSTFSDGATQLPAFQIEYIESNVFGIKVKEQINRERGSWYNLAINAQDCVNCDSNEPRLEQIYYLRINITNVFEYPPIFIFDDDCNSTETKCVQTVYIPENELYEEPFMEAFDEDNISGDETESVYYHLVEVQPSDGKITLKDINGETPAITAKNLDRESIENYTVIIDTYNDKPYSVPPLPHTAPLPNRLFLSVLVLDKYDMTPEFNNINNVTFGSFMPTDSTEDVLLTIEANDLDLNETLLYDISGDFIWTGSDPPNSDQPFKFDQNIEADPRSAQLILNFNPKGQAGYCTFPITVTDKGNLKSSTEARIFSITEDLQAQFYFDNTIADLQRKQDDLQNSLTSVFGYDCKIDNIEQPSGQVTREESAENNIVTTHFIDTAQNTVVAKDVIESMAVGEKASDLIRAMGALDLSLSAIGESNIETPTDNSQLYMILLGLSLGVVSLVLVLLGFAYHRSTTNLKRQVKALSANTFGSMSSEIDKIGLDSAPVPGSNQFSGEGTNPMYNLQEIKLQEEDTSSVGSGDSVLVGVEDTEDFRNYGRGKARAPQPPGKRTNAVTSHGEGHVNQAFTGRSIDQVSASAPPAAFDNATRSNPLLQFGEEKDLTDALADYQFNVARRSSSDMEDDDPGSSALNSNFTFG